MNKYAKRMNKYAILVFHPSLSMEIVSEHNGLLKAYLNYARFRFREWYAKVRWGLDEWPSVLYKYGTNPIVERELYRYRVDKEIEVPKGKRARVLYCRPHRNRGNYYKVICPCGHENVFYAWSWGIGSMEAVCALCGSVIHYGSLEVEGK
jgi:ribosomal protein S27E